MREGLASVMRWVHQRGRGTSAWSSLTSNSSLLGDLQSAFELRPLVTSWLGPAGSSIQPVTRSSANPVCAHASLDDTCRATAT
eukprot:1174328-Prorocentrum_minimum.AAC.1